MKLEIFPYLFSRYASLRVEELNKMQFRDGDRYFSQWMQLIASKEQGRDELCALLFELINMQADETQRKLLLNLKRAVFNDRNNIAAVASKLTATLQLEIDACLLAFFESKMKFEEFLKQWEQRYSEVVLDNRTVVKSLIASYAFQNGILLSSKALYQQLGNFVKTPSAEIDKRAWRTEFSILRYLTRMAYKTSPFSTLTYMGLTTLSQDESRSAGSPTGTIHSKVRLNNKLLKRIKGLMERHNSLNSLMYISLNSSAEIAADKLSYLFNSANIETFQKIPASPINTHIYHLLAAHDKDITLGQLAIQLSEQINDDLEEIKVFLLKLVDTGLLELSLRCSEIMPEWETKLLEFLQPHIDDIPSATLLFGMVKELQKVKLQFVAAPVAQREVLLGEIARNLDAGFSLLEEEAGLVSQSPEEIKVIREQIIEKYRNGHGFEKLPYIPFDYRQESIFYEDTFTQEERTLPAADINLITEKLNGLCTRLSGLDLRKPERNATLTFFKENYHSAQQIPIMDFYQAYYRRKENRAADFNFKESIAENPEQETDWKTSFQEALATCTQDHDCIHLRYEDLDALPSSNFSIQAYSVFIQLFKVQNSHATQGVINGLMPGMGKLNGRFLHLFNPDIATVLRERNHSFLPDRILMELNDGSSFNANIHPPLLDYEIKMPASNTLMDDSSQIGLNNIAVAYQEDLDKLMLLEIASGKEIYAFDLCLESLSNRSNLYQMLSNFNPIPYGSYHPIIHVVDHYFLQKQNNISTGIRINPRISYEKDIVIRRKGWIVSKASLPEDAVDENDSSYYLKLKQWIQVQQIPDDVFIFLKSAYLPKVENQEDLTTRDDYKPQYISFNQPLLVKLFRRLIRRAGAQIYLEEVLPAVHPSDPAHCVSEHLLQWYQK